MAAVSHGGGGFMDIVKAQLIMSTMGNAAHGRPGGVGGGGGELSLRHLVTMLAPMFLLFLFDALRALVAEIVPLIKKRISDYYAARLERLTESIRRLEAVAPRLRTAEMTFERDYTQQNNWDRADAVLSKVLHVPDSNEYLVVGQLELIKNRAPFEIAPNIKFVLLELTIDNERGAAKHVRFTLSSTQLDVCELRAFVDELVDEYTTARRNNLGTRTYYFDQIVAAPGSAAASLQANAATARVTFSKHLFVTNRTLDNVFHERAAELKKRVEFFMTQKAWYDAKGMAYTLGLLFTGEKGTGKTSTIKAIANATGRHVLNVNFGAIRSLAQLKRLFYDERISVSENPDNPAAPAVDYVIPIARRIYVLEDIDASAAQSFLMKRHYRDEIEHRREEEDYLYNPMAPPGSRLAFATRARSVEAPSDIDLAAVLNLIDGVLETPGRIMIVTSNFPGKLDEAFIRPGRIDMMIDFRKCSHAVVADMFRSFYESEISPEALAKVREYAWTPAEVAQILFKNFGEPAQAERDLGEIDPAKYFKYEDKPLEPEPTTTLFTEVPQTVAVIANSTSAVSQSSSCETMDDESREGSSDAGAPVEQLIMAEVGGVESAAPKLGALSQLQQHLQQQTTQSSPSQQQQQQQQQQLSRSVSQLPSIHGWQLPSPTRLTQSASAGSAGPKSDGVTTTNPTPDSCRQAATTTTSSSGGDDRTGGCGDQPVYVPKLQLTDEEALRLRQGVMQRGPAAAPPPQRSASPPRRPAAAASSVYDPYEAAAAEVAHHMAGQDPQRPGLRSFDPADLPPLPDSTTADVPFLPPARAFSEYETYEEGAHLAGLVGIVDDDASILAARSLPPGFEHLLTPKLQADLSNTPDRHNAVNARPTR